MTLDALKAAVPDFAKDLKLNLGSVIGNSDLPQQQLWGTVLSCAIAARSPRVLRELEPEAKANLSPEATGSQTPCVWPGASCRPARQRPS